MSRPAAHAARWRTFEVVVGLPVAIAIVLQAIVPWSLPLGGSSPARVAIGSTLVLVGSTLVIRARWALRRHGQPTDPGRPTSALVTEDVFAVSRNPLYVGGLATLLGGAVALDAPWVVGALVPAAVACHALLIVPEERYLRATFGAAYVDYTRRVRRWLGRSPRRGRGQASPSP